MSVASSSLEATKFPLPSYERLLRRLRTWIARLQPRDKAPTSWQNRDVWDQVVVWMIDEEGMEPPEPEDRKLMLDYLSTHYEPDRK